ncbi:MAG: hypothetical protein LBF90_03130 [Prevotellaceae bacterium]|nr:hypothetical protein [Prevotellaceae bacterium]
MQSKESGRYSIAPCTDTYIYTFACPPATQPSVKQPVVRTRHPQRYIPRFALHVANLSRHVANFSRHVANFSRHVANLSRHVANLSRHVANPSRHVANSSRHVARRVSLKGRYIIAQGNALRILLTTGFQPCRRKGSEDRYV